ncbi:MAG TPA: low specificity L-threonine aldolase [Gemmatimonadales bacterium]|nr:low specificity L-threonine aldolase [Gemmatimonadales bacterium]
MPSRFFASDNAAPAHPEVLAALARANEGHAVAYGADPWTERATELIRAELGGDSRVFFVFAGTAANVLGLTALTRRYGAVICSADAHIDQDETGAPERHLGVKLIDLPTPDGKLRLEQLPSLLAGRGVEHHVQPDVLALTQSTERGTVYRIEELRALCDWAHREGLRVHVDGARLANAAVSLGVGLGAITRDVGVDALSLGGTKNGLLGAEAVVFFDPAQAEGFRYLRKQGMQLASKHRYLAAQFEALFTGGLWRRSAEHANAMAQRLAASAREVNGVTVTQSVEANGVFARLPDRVIAPLREAFPFYVWRQGTDGTSEVRWMCSWDTTEADVDAFVGRLRELSR